MLIIIIIIIIVIIIIIIFALGSKDPYSGGLKAYSKKYVRSG